MCNELQGSRASEKAEIRAYLEKQIGTKMKLNSPGPGYGSAGEGVPCFAVETGTYKQGGTGKTIEGQYLRSAAQSAKLAPPW